MTRDDGSECFDPGFQTICHHTLIALSDRMSTSAAAVAPQSGGSRRARAVAVSFFLGQHGPDDPCGLGGERRHGDLVGPPSQQLAQPGIADAAPLLLPQIGAGAVDQQCAQHAVSLFGTTAVPIFAAHAKVGSDEAEQGCKVASGTEHPGVSYLRQSYAGDDRSHPRHYYQPARLWVATDGLHDLLLQHPLFGI